MTRKLSESEQRILSNQLIKLGDMMGDGLHLEPDGKWISREHRKLCRRLGYIKPPPRNTGKIDEHMAERCKNLSCPKCGGAFKQSRSGSLRAICLGCGAKYQLLKSVKRPAS